MMTSSNGSKKDRGEKAEDLFSAPHHHPNPIHFLSHQPPAFSVYISITPNDWLVEGTLITGLHPIGNASCCLFQTLIHCDAGAGSKGLPDTGAHL
jgi:hypothetical protein